MAHALKHTNTLEGPFEFDSSTLVSVLRIATLYYYPALRVNAIKHLEQAQLAAVEHIKIGREFGLTPWESGLHELCMSDEVIEMEEASVLELDNVVRIAKIQEKEQRRRGEKINARTQGQGVGCDVPRVITDAQAATHVSKSLPIDGIARSDNQPPRLSTTLNSSQSEPREGSGATTSRPSPSC